MDPSISPFINSFSFASILNISQISTYASRKVDIDHLNGLNILIAKTIDPSAITSSINFADPNLSQDLLHNYLSLLNPTNFPELIQNPILLQGRVLSGLSDPISYSCEILYLIILNAHVCNLARHNELILRNTPNHEEAANLLQIALTLDKRFLNDVIPIPSSTNTSTPAISFASTPASNSIPTSLTSTAPASTPSTNPSSTPPIPTPTTSSANPSTTPPSPFASSSQAPTTPITTPIPVTSTSQFPAPSPTTLGTTLASSLASRLASNSPAPSGKTTVDFDNIVHSCNDSAKADTNIAKYMCPLRIIHADIRRLVFDQNMSLNHNLLHSQALSLINKSRSKSAFSSFNSTSTPTLPYTEWLDSVADEAQAIISIPAFKSIPLFELFIGSKGMLDHNKCFLTAFAEDPEASPDTIFKNMSIFYKLVTRSTHFDSMFHQIILRNKGAVLRLDTLQVLYPVFELLRDTLHQLSLPHSTPLDNGKWLHTLWLPNLNTIFSKWSTEHTMSFLHSDIYSEISLDIIQSKTKSRRPSMTPSPAKKSKSTFKPSGYKPLSFLSKTTNSTNNKPHTPKTVCWRHLAHFIGSTSLGPTFTVSDCNDKSYCESLGHFHDFNNLKKSKAKSDIFSFSKIKGHPLNRFQEAPKHLLSDIEKSNKLK